MNEADARLWHGWRRRRDHAAFEALVRPHLRFLADFARRKGIGSADADDLVQQVLAGLAADRSDRPVSVGLRAYLGRSLALRSKMLRRASVRRVRHESVPRPTASSSDPVADRDLVEACLRELPEPQREAVILRYLHDMEYDAIAYLTGASVNACRLRVHKGITRMRDRVGNRAGALVAMLPLLAGHSEAALVKGALAKGAAIPLVAAGGVLAVKKTIAAVVVLACVAGSFYLWGSSDQDERAPRSDAPPQEAKAQPPEPREPAVEEKEEAPKPRPVDPKPDLSKLELLGKVFGQGGRALVAFAPRPAYLGGKDKIKWYPLGAELPEGSPTGFQAQGPKSLEILPLLADLQAVYVLDLYNSGFRDDHLKQIAHLRTMLALDLTKSRITDKGLEHLLGMTELRSLHVSDTSITDEGLRAIGQMRSLRHLGVRDTKITDAGFEHLKGLVNLEFISFAGPGTTDKAVSVLAELPGIQHLHLADVRMSDVVLERVVRMPRLRKLRLEHFQSLKALSGARSLEELNLSDAEFEGEELAYLPTTLRDLDLAETSLEAGGLEHLAGLTNLEKLNLEETDLDDEAMVHLAGLTRLRSLEMDDTGISDAGIKHLAKLTRLVSLQIGENKITDASVDVLARLKNLRYLDLKETRITAAGLARLKTALPACKIRKP